MVIAKTKNFTKKLLLGRFDVSLSADDVGGARAYIAGYWPKLTRFHPKDDESLLGLPHPYLVPAYEAGHEFDFNEFYYWDSYFMVQGMMGEQHKELVTGVLDNIISLYERFKIIPNASRTYLTGRSQPPLLSSFIRDVHQTYGFDNEWLAKHMEVAKAEYQGVWMGTSKPNTRQVFRGLSRYYDINHLNDLAEAESGWDLTPRFNRKCLDYLPVDLNSLLYKYETDFLYTAELLGSREEAEHWRAAANARRQTMNDLMWSDLKKMYYDYNYAKERLGSVSSLAGYYPMWAGIASEEQARKLVNNLGSFEQKGGLATTDTPTFSQRVPGTMPVQWAYPNGWAPLHFIVVKGLQRYGYHKQARRIAMKWLKTNLDWYNKHGVFLEKYNVVQPEKPPVKGNYPSQTGFGWTNAVFEYFCQQFIDAKQVQ